MPTIGVDPDGQFVHFIIGAVMDGISGWQIGKSQGAKGWGMFGYIFGGAAIGAATAGVASSVASATAAWGPLASGLASGAAGGFVGGGFNAALAGGNFWQGALKGAMWGGAIGGVSGYLSDLYFDWRIEKELLNSKYGLAQQGDPIYKGKDFVQDVVIKAKRNAFHQLSMTSQAVGQALGAFAANVGPYMPEVWPPYSYTGAVTPSYPEALLMPIPKIGFGGNGMANARALGIAGERAAGITGSKTGVMINGRVRFPDALSREALIEVKNVKSLNFTRQLRDYQGYAQSKNLDMILYTRPSTALSGPLQKAINNNLIIHRYIPK